MSLHTAYTNRETPWHRYGGYRLRRFSMGAVIFGFGMLKYFPGVSPAQTLVLATTELLTFGREHRRDFHEHPQAASA